MHGSFELTDPATEFYFSQQQSLITRKKKRTEFDSLLHYGSTVVYTDERTYREAGAVEVEVGREEVDAEAARGAEELAAAGDHPAAGDHDKVLLVLI